MYLTKPTINFSGTVRSLLVKLCLRWKIFDILFSDCRWYRRVAGHVWVKEPHWWDMEGYWYRAGIFEPHLDNLPVERRNLTYEYY